MTIRKNIELIKRILAADSPELVSAFRAPATMEELGHLESVVGQPLPEDFKELYGIHNGNADLGGPFFSGIFLSLEEIEQEWRIWNSIASEEFFELDMDCVSVPDEWIQEQYASPHWLPFTSDGSGNHLAVDLVPGPKGVRGQVINIGRDETTKYVVAPSLESFFEFIAGIFERGDFQKGEDDELLLAGQRGNLLDALPYLELPFGLTTKERGKPNPGMSFAQWLDKLDENWREIVAGHIRSVETGYHDLASVTALMLLDSEISNVEPVSKFTSIRELILTGTAVADISPLRACPLVRKLYLASTRVTDLSPLSELSQLKSLSLYNTDVQDLSPLYDLPKLAELSLEATHFPDLQQLLRLPHLCSLDISGNAFASFSPLSQLKSLRVLDLSQTNFSDLALLKPLNKLAKLNIGMTPVTDYGPVTALPNLMDVTCSIDAFMQIKSILERKSRFSIMGEMTVTQEKACSDYVHES